MSLQQLQEKWAPVLNHDALPEIKDSHKRGVVAQLLENQERALTEEAHMLNETLATSGSSPAGFSGAATPTGPVSAIRRHDPRSATSCPRRTASPPC